MNLQIPKDLNPDGTPMKNWLRKASQLFSEHPEKARADYVELVKSIAYLHQVEQILRVEVLGLGDPAAPYINIENSKKSGLPVADFDISTVLMNRLNPLIDLFLDAASNSIMKKL